MTLLFVGVALAASLVPGGPERLEYRRAWGESWAIGGLLTGQLVHWTPRMIVFDLGAVLLLGAWLERRSRLLVLIVIGTSWVLVGLGVHFFTDVETYRGASGIASALFVAAVVRIGEETERPVPRIAAVVLLLLFISKVAYELATGRAIAAGSLPPGVETLPIAHLIGALTGLVHCWRPFQRRTVRPPDP